MKKFLKYGSILLVILLIWDANVTLPLRFFALYVNQIGHLLIALLFSYSPGEDILINISQPTYEIVNQRSFLSAFLIANAGYIASLTFMMFAISLKSSIIKTYATSMFAISFLLLAYVYSGISEHLLYAGILAIVALVLQMVNKDNFYNYTLNVLGLSSLAFIIYDLIFGSLSYSYKLGFGNFQSDIPYSGAIQLETLTGLPLIVWVLIWSIITFVTCILLVMERPTEETEEEAEEE